MSAQADIKAKTKSKRTERVRASLRKRYAAEKRFKLYGIVAIGASIGFLFILLFSIVSKGLPAFKQTYLKLDVSLTTDALGVSDSPTYQELRSANYAGVVKQAMRDRFPDVKKRGDKKALYKLVSTGAQYQLYDRINADLSLLGTDLSLWVLADDELSAIIKSKENLDAPETIATRMTNRVGKGFERHRLFGCPIQHHVFRKRRFTRT
jgi:phosphate transport system permease protein